MKPLTSLFACLCISLVYSSCKPKPTELVFKSPRQSLVDSVNAAISDSTSPGDISQPGSKGAQWRAWIKWFKNCPKNATFKSDIVYLGPSNSRDLGYILSKNKKYDRWDFYKVGDTAKFSDFIHFDRDVQQCDVRKISDFSFDMLIDANLWQTVNAELGGLIKNAKDVKINAGTWHIESLETGPFSMYLSTAENKNIPFYRKSMLDDGNVIITKVLKMSGFDISIASKDSISAGLKATLDNGFNVNVVPTDSSRKIGFSLNFKRVAKDTLRVVSTGQVVLFAQISKGEDVIR
ncbi:hypothetical protein SAMN05660461_0950 [Chitinophaga ginsengisegetis]|uniref:Uncharacterized protein n=1 Tax=Chitinophaga ginsengisegetis TaxID=393003 RepID=A0A1T5NAY0_9BACT|nr:hypothetical protein [Chitinophaga ginsengisegetis]SKC97572.1 hypothetical protein SAMN05660461_0950 [Chitinophaga ginsengisegetis]